MKIEIKNLKHCEFASEETHCFEASLYVEGKRLCVVSNDGHGGPNRYMPATGVTASHMQKQIDAVEAELSKETWDFHGRTMHNCLEIVVGNLVERTLLLRQAKKLVKKICYTDGKEVYSLPPEYKPTEANIAALKKLDWWEPHYQVLNELSFEEVIDLPALNP